MLKSFGVSGFLGLGPQRCAASSSARDSGRAAASGEQVQGFLVYRLP